MRARGGRGGHRAPVKIGPYEVLDELGRGGMGVVHRVRAPDGREHALKLLFKSDPTALARFERERRLLASLGERQGFVRLEDSGQAEKGAWLLMPLVTGGDLRRKLARGPLGVEETVALGIQLARALGHAHERGIVHRDVKPENVLFTAEGQPLVADLGIARHFDRAVPGAAESVTLTERGMFRGTAAYAAPEQMSDAARAGPPADVFALGAVLYECLAGLPAFAGENVLEVLSRVSSGVVNPIERADVPPWLEEIVKKALAGDPGQRFPDGAALAAALSRGTKPAARRAPLAIGAVAAVVTLGLLLLVIAWRAPTNRSAELAALARQKLLASDLDGAIAAATEAIELDPKLGLAWACRGTARSKKGDWEGALVDSTKAVELDPSLGWAWRNRGCARGKKGDWDGMIADTTRAIALEPQVVAGWTDRAEARGARGDWQGTIDDETRAIALEPTLAVCWANRGLAKHNLGDLDGALADEARAIELDPKLALAWSERGQLREERGDRVGSLADVSRAVELEPGTGVYWAIRGAMRGQEGDWAGAEADMQRALELDPSGANAPEMRRQLETVRRRRGH